MTESTVPEKKNETAESTEDELIIDLKDDMAVDPADDDEPIDLTEIVKESPAEDKGETVEAGAEARIMDEAPTMPEEVLKGDEEIIDLLQAIEEPIVTGPDQMVAEKATEPAESQTPTELDMDGAEAKEPSEDEAPIVLEEEATEETEDDNEIINLADAAEEISLTENAGNVVEEVAVPAEDEAIIDLIETAGETSLETENIGEPISDDFDMATEFDDISELESDFIQQTADASDESDSATMADDVLKDDFADSLGLELDSEEGAKENLIDTDKVTNDQVEVALERVIKKMFYEKIDRLLVDTIEKTVTREIERLKKALLDDATDSE